MKQILKLSTYHWTVVFFLCGLFFIGFVLLSVNLFQMSMANIEFIQEHGFTAIMAGALIQTIELAAVGIMSLFLYLGFKCCEGDLISRYNTWNNKA
ncbi:hypothetical protein ACWU4D_04855 [Vibrio sp. WJH972]